MSKNREVIDVKPSMKEISRPVETEQYYSVTIKAGQAMGLLLALTYKTGFTVMSSKAP